MIGSSWNKSFPSRLDPSLEMPLLQEKLMQRNESCNIIQFTFHLNSVHSGFLLHTGAPFKEKKTTFKETLKQISMEEIL